jgi:hypothetical protein
VAIHAKNPLFAAGGTLWTEEFVYTIESCLRTLAFARVPMA